MNGLTPADRGRIVDWAYEITGEGAIIGASWHDGERRGFILVPDEA